VTDSTSWSVELKVRLGLLLGAVLFFSVSTAFAPRAYAASDQINIYPSLLCSPLYDFGWHFDEGSSWFAAQDFSPHCGSGEAVVYAKMVLSSGVAWRYNIWAPNGVNGCVAAARLQYWNGSVWVDTPGTDMHYLHLNSIQTGGTGGMQTAGQYVWKTVGYVATSGSCLFGNPHSHLSGNIEPVSYLYMVNRSGETCWANSTGYCNAVYTRRHLAGSPCPPSTPEAFNTTLSGNISTYICETWSIKSHPQSSRTLKIRW
jgi:hypothetical protein